MSKKEQISGIFICLVFIGWIVLMTFLTVNANNKNIKLETKIEELETVIGDLFDDLDDAFYFINEDISNLEEHIEYLEELYDKEQRPSFEDYQYGIAKIVSRKNYDDYYAYVIEIQETLSTVYSQELFSVGEDILIIEYSEGKIILIDLS